MEYNLYIDIFDTFDTKMVIKKFYIQEEVVNDKKRIYFFFPSDPTKYWIP